ncbi:hypothetical protein [Pedobacter sp. SYSU D00535]|uniref:hypothetical protein n=1 Tax=Pedobacter sp. SYSU D00535 TaxID=2810308 RepID=UPI001A9618F6|nr:hypothetical protein [Pedobacter sp. SYSU D00535]
MNGIILDKMQENGGTCYLTKITLSDFVTSLSLGYQDYEVQREIVTNTYLDSLIDTVLQQKHIPPIVLVIDAGNFTIQNENITITEFKILDGLQRTYRLKLIWDSIQFFNAQVLISDEILELKRIQLSRRYSEQLEKINSNSKILEAIIKFYKEKSTSQQKVAVENCFNNYQWFEIWSNLTPQQEVNKMLVLNAGHKPVKTQHQLELLFLNLIPIIKKSGLDSFELIREKDSNSTVFSKNRKKGQFHFSHLITAILSLNEGRPITANVNLVHKTQSSDFDIEQFDNYFNYEVLHKFIEILLKLDTSIEKQFGELGTKWMGREVSLVGMFAALGKFRNKESHSTLTMLEKLDEIIVKNPASLNLTEYEVVRNSLDLSKINIGTVNKSAIYNGIYALLLNNEQIIIWSNHFKGQTV